MITFPFLSSNYFLSWIINIYCWRRDKFSILVIKWSKHRILSKRVTVYKKIIVFVLELERSLTNNWFIYLPYEIIYYITSWIYTFFIILISCSNNTKYVRSHLPYLLEWTVNVIYPISISKWITDTNRTIITFLILYFE